MAITTLSAREFNQQVGKAKQQAKDGPVFITDRGKRTHVLLNIDEYQKMKGGGRSLAEALALPALTAIDEDFEFPRVESEPRPAEFG